MQIRKMQVFMALIAFLAAVPSEQQITFAQSKAEPKIRVSQAPLTADQLAIYRVLLHRWRDNDKFPIHLAIQTIPLETTGTNDDWNCDKTLELEDVKPGAVHRFQESDLPKIGSSKISLVDAQKQEEEVSENDPGKHIGAPDSIDKAVDNGFSHGLVSLGEIRFDKKHEHAIVWYGFHCGMLCGNGGTVVLEKKKDLWKVKSQCSVWISKVESVTHGLEG